MQKSREELKEIFVTGAKPQQRDYWDLFDSFLHKEELSRALARLEEISINPELAWQRTGWWLPCCVSLRRA